MALHIYNVYIKNVIRYELRVTYAKREKEKECVCVRELANEWASERMIKWERRSGGECASAMFILCCARKNVNYSKVRPAITYHLLFQIITVCSKCNIKKKIYRYHEIKYSVRKHIKDVSLFRTFFSAEERWKTCRVASISGPNFFKHYIYILIFLFTSLWIRFCDFWSCIKKNKKNVNVTCGKERQ